MTNSTDQHDGSSFRLLLPGAASSAAPSSPQQSMSLLQQVHAWGEKARRPFWESGLWCASLACIIFSFSSLQVKLTGGRVPVLQLCIIRSSLSFCTSVAVGLASGIKPLFGHREHRHLLFLRGFFGTLAISTSYVALLSLPLGDAVTIAQMRPPVTALMARLLLNEPLGPLGAVGSLVSVAGVTVLAHPPFLFGGHGDWSQKRLVGTLCGVASTLFGFGATYAIRRIGKREPALVVALWFHTTTICLMTGPLLLGLPQQPKSVAPHDCLLLLGIAAASFCAQLLMTRSYQLIAAARAAAVSFTGVIYSHILGALIFNERLTPSTLTGGVLIFIGVLMVTVRSSSSSNDPSSSSTAISTGSTAHEKCTASDTDTYTAVAGSTAVHADEAVQSAAADVVNQQEAVLPVQQQQRRPRRSTWLQQLLARPVSSSSSNHQYHGVPVTEDTVAVAFGQQPQQQQQQQQQNGASNPNSDLDPFGRVQANNTVSNTATPASAALHPVHIHSPSRQQGSTELHMQRDQLSPLVQSESSEVQEAFPSDMLDPQQPFSLRQNQLSWVSWASFSSVGSMQEQGLGAEGQQQQQQQQGQQQHMQR